MTSKPETVLKQIEGLPCKAHSEKFIEFYNWLIDEEDSKPTNGITYLKTLRPFSLHNIKVELEDVSKEDVLDFLNTKKKPLR